MALPIVRNTALNDLRDQRVHEHLDENWDGVPQPAEVAAQRAELASVVGRIQDLPTPQREALVKRELEGRSHEEIAASMGATPGAVRGLIFRARAALRDGAGILIPMPALRALLDAGPMQAETAGVGIGGAAAGLTAGGGGGLAIKARPPPPPAVSPAAAPPMPTPAVSACMGPASSRARRAGIGIKIPAPSRRASEDQAPHSPGVAPMLSGDLLVASPLELPLDEGLALHSRRVVVSIHHPRRARHAGPPPRPAAHTVPVLVKVLVNSLIAKVVERRVCGRSYRATGARWGSSSDLGSDR